MLEGKFKKIESESQEGRKEKSRSLEGNDKKFVIGFTVERTIKKLFV